MQFPIKDPTMGLICKVLGDEDTATLRRFYESDMLPENDAYKGKLGLYANFKRLRDLVAAKNPNESFRNQEMVAFFGVLYVSVQKEKFFQGEEMEALERIQARILSEGLEKNWMDGEGKLVRIFDAMEETRDFMRSKNFSTEDADLFAFNQTHGRFFMGLQFYMGKELGVNLEALTDSVRVVLAGDGNGNPDPEAAGIAGVLEAMLEAAFAPDGDDCTCPACRKRRGDLVH